MDRRRLEARVFDIVERVAAGRRVEDDLVECKAGWIDPAKAARRLAGQANAARGDDIVWIVGVDEDAHRVAAPDSTETSKWWAQVEKRFTDGVTPDPTFVNVPTPHGTIVAIGFATDRSPYMVSTAGGGGVDREIPWRTATGIRTAHRGEVLSLLVEATNSPAIELIRPVLQATHYQASDDTYSDQPEPERIELVLRTKIFFEPPSRPAGPIMLPSHQWSATFELGQDGSHAAELRFRPNSVAGPGPTGRASEAPHLDGAWVRDSGIYVQGPDTLTVEATAVLTPERRQAVANRSHITVTVRMPVSGSPRAATAQQELRWVTGDRSVEYPPGTILGVWTQPRD